MRFPSRFNFRLPVASERWQQRLQRPWQVAAHSPWLLPLAVALAAHALWLAGAGLLDRPRQQATGLRAGDDTPELLRFSRRAAETAALPAGLSSVTLPFDGALPPPPPELGASLPSARAKASAERTPQRQRPTAAASLERNAPQWGLEQGTLQGLPTDPLTALSLAERLADGPSVPGANAEEAPAGDPDSRSSTGSPPEGGGERKEAASPAATAAAATALARRQLRLSPKAERPYLGLWEQAVPVSSRPDFLAALPETAELRRLPLSQARQLGLRQPHGLSVLSSHGLLLLWTNGEDLWLIRTSRSGGSA